MTKAIVGLLSSLDEAAESEDLLQPKRKQLTARTKLKEKMLGILICTGKTITVFQVLSSLGSSARLERVDILKYYRVPHRLWATLDVSFVLWCVARRRRTKLEKRTEAIQADTSTKA